MATREEEALQRVARDPRRQWGWDPSPLASVEEQRAYQAYEMLPRVAAGELPVSALPEAYGGRPQGSSRRAIRQQWEWDQARKQQLAEEQAARQVEEFNGAMAMRDLEYQTKSLDLSLKRSDLAADLQNQKIINEQANVAIGILGQYPDTPEGIAAAAAQINKIAPRAWESETVGKNYYYKDKNSAAVVGAIEAQSEDAKQQAQLNADVITYGITPEQQQKMLESNLPAGVVRFDPLKAIPVIAAAKQAQEAVKTTKAEEKETKKSMASKEDDYQKALATYEGLAGDKNAVPEEVAKARAAVRGAAAVLGIPKVANEDDLKNYNSGDKVLAPDGITVITIP
jgi:hypothetical protein